MTELVLSSAGLPEARTAKSAISAASRSTAEWIASEMTETEPLSRPESSLNAISVVFDTTESSATADFLLWSFTSAFLAIKDVVSVQARL